MSMFFRVEEEVKADSIEAKVDSFKNTDKDTQNKGRFSLLFYIFGFMVHFSLGVKRPLGISGVMGILDNKKKKLSTLQKTKLDWNSFKSAEGIEEQLEDHKKSKDG